MLTTSHEQDLDHTLEIPNRDRASDMSRLVLNTRTGIATLFDKTGSVITQSLLEQEELARFISQDRYAKKYASMSPYGYCANNPVNFVDPTGDTISLLFLRYLDEMLGTNIWGTLVNDLSAQTGFTFIELKNGDLVYAKDANGNAMIKKDENGNPQGSTTAREFMENAIDHEDRVNLIGANRSGVQPGTNTIGLSYRQIDGFINGAVNLDSRTLGYGMSFMHELYHTNVGGGLHDTPNGLRNPGPVEKQMNIIRAELNAQGGNYGQRVSYEAYGMGDGKSYLPFNSAAQGLLNQGTIPSVKADNQFIKF